MTKDYLTRWQGNFWTGLAIVLPGVISVAALVWLFSTMTRITDTLLIFVPRKMTHADLAAPGDGGGEMYWYWSLVALLVAVLLICLVGLLARNYFGKQMIKWVDSALLRVPLLNKIYTATKQVNDAFSSSKKTAFRGVVVVEFPRPGIYSLGFITGEQDREVQARLGQQAVCVFVPATPNPTSGFLLFVPEDKLTRLQMSVADGIKYIVSLGSILPEPPRGLELAAASARPAPAGHD